MAAEAPKQRVAEALRRLPILPEREASVDQEALQIVLAAALHGTQDTRAFQRAGTKKASKQLEELLRALQKVESVFGNLPREAWEALEEETQRAEVQRKADGAKGIYRRKLVRPAMIYRAETNAFIEAVNAARERLAETDPTTGGRPRKSAAPAVTRQARKAYQRLTGMDRKASYDPLTSQRYGPFVDLLEEIFQALGIEASAASQAANS